MIIACDVDGITCDLHVEWLRRYNRDYNDTLTVEGCRSWNMHDWVKPECGRKIYDYLSEPDLYEHVPPVDGSQNGVERIRSLGHQLFFVTANTYGMTDPKARWLIQYGFCKENKHHLPEEYVPLMDKNALDARLLIDDGAHNVLKWVNGKGRPAILLERPYNLHLQDEVHSAFWARCFRAFNWDDIVRHVESMSHAA